MSEDKRERRRCACDDPKCQVGHGSKRCGTRMIVNPAYTYITEYLCDSCCGIDTKSLAHESKRAQRRVS